MCIDTPAHLLYNLRMAAELEISVTNTTRENGYRIFTLSTTNSTNQFEYKIYVSDKDIPFKESALTPEALENFAISEMRLWIEKSDGQLPQNRFMLLMNGGKITTNDIENDIQAVLSAQEKISDLVRTNVTIAAPLFEWAKAKAQKEETSFSDLVSRGLITLKDSDKEIEAWFKEQGAYFRKQLGGYGSFEVFHYLPNNYKEFAVDSIKNALQEAELKRTGWPIGVYLTNSDKRPQPQEDGIKAESMDNPSVIFDYWYAKNKGEFYFSRILESDNGNGTAEPKTSLYFDTLIWRVAEALEHSLAYYKKLNIDEKERIKLKMSLYGLNGRKLSAWNPARAFILSHYICNSEKSSWEMETSLQELNKSLDNVIYEAVKKLLIMFDFFVPNEAVVFDILNKEYRKSNF